MRKTRGQGRQKSRASAGRGREAILGYDEGGFSDPEEGVLTIGGVRLKVDGSGNVRSSNRRNARQQRRAVGRRAGEARGPGSSSDGSGSDADAALRDYLANAWATDSEAEGASDEEIADADGSGGPTQEGEEAAGTAKAKAAGKAKAPAGPKGKGQGGGGSLKAHLHLLRHFSSVEIGAEPGVEDGGWATTDGGSSSDASSSDGSEWGEDAMPDVLTAEDLAGMTLAQRFPVQARPAKPAPGQRQAPKAAAAAEGRGPKRKTRPGVCGANGGKLAPGEKKRLKVEARQAKRAARAAARGFDLAAANAELAEFVAGDGDVMAFPPMQKHECQVLFRLVALYGCRGTLQGSGKRKCVVVAATHRTAAPAGSGLLAVAALLAAQHAAERSGTALDPRLLAPRADVGSLLLGQRQGGGGGKAAGGGRWVAARQTGAAKPPHPLKALKRGAAQGQQAPSRPAAGQRKFNKPLAFVSSGCIDPQARMAVFLPSGRQPAGAEGGEPEEEEDEGEAMQLLEVFEDFGGGTTSSCSEDEKEEEDGEEDSEEEAEEEERGHPGLGTSPAAVLYTRVEGLGLPGGGGAARGSARGSAAAEGITNPGRLLGLGLALGLGPEVFGAPGPAGAGAAADVATLSPLLSKSARRKQERSTRRAPGSFSAPSPAAISPALRGSGMDSAGGGGASARRGAKPPGGGGGGGRTKAQRRRRVSLLSDSEADAGAAGSPGGGGGLVAGDYGDFERHTTGIGSKLLEKWGFAGAGAGLGREGRGVAEPVQALRRAKGLGLGAEGRA